ncbi:hypothetical protein DSECCO2_599110 [anaerobic digester metagenome]
MIKPATATKRAALIKTKSRADNGDISEAGISLEAVLGLRASISLSAHLLNPIAAFLAKTIANITSPRRLHEKWPPPLSVPRKRPVRAKGIAKIV